MKFRKLLISASAIAAGSGLLATVLTSCAKANIDSKLRIDLDDEGKLYKPGKMESKTFTWREAVTQALTRSSNWTQFKAALADEIVYNWYVDRASVSKTDDKKNSTFRTNLDEWTYQINKDYDNVVQTCKNKYGANWQFYLQNEYLSVNGGTEEAYKHIKLVDKVKADFTSKVFAKNYFGYRTSENENNVYPFTFTAASKNVNADILNNPDEWGKLGFYARTDLSFPTPTTIPGSYTEVTDELCNFLAKHPEGDYAAIQDYVFHRWFKADKPFFSAAALFKYSMPARVAGGKLDQIYNTIYTGVKLPDKTPNEEFPFFGAGTDGSTKKAVNFLSNLSRQQYATIYNVKGTEYSNKTVTIKKEDTDDSQTLLLMHGNTMFDNIYMPYAMACGNMYDQMIYGHGSEHPNKLSIDIVKKNIENWKEGTVDDFAMLSNFFYVQKPDTQTETKGITHYLDLNDVYGGLSGDGETEETAYVYHCPLFAECPTYTYFYGNPYAQSKPEKVGDKWYDFGKSGIRYITNSIEITGVKVSEKDDTQPWVMELNQSGVHFQTIDGFNYVKNAGTAPKDRLAALEKVFKYRVMEKQIKAPCEECISTDLLGESGKLKSYFTDNYASIILELAQLSKEEDIKYQVFRNIASYKESTIKQDETLLLYKIWKDQGLGKTFGHLIDYLDLLIDYEDTKKIITNLENVNTKIFAYRSKQITNSKSDEKFSKTIFENGLLAPLAYAPTNTTNVSTRDYKTVNRIVVQDIIDEPDSEAIEKVVTQGYNTIVKEKQDKISDKTAYVAEVLAEASVNGSTGFSPQIATAKSTMSNRFWYKSSIVDKVIHTFMGAKAYTANQIKMNAYNYYVQTKDPNHDWFDGDKAGAKLTYLPTAQAFSTTYKRAKVLTGDRNLSAFISASELKDYTVDKFYSTMDSEFDKLRERDKLNNGEFSDETLSYELFKATILYLLADETTNEDASFGNFYTMLNSKISEDEDAIVGYMNKDYSRTSEQDWKPTPYISSDPTKTTSYDWNPAVDNEFDKIGYAGGDKADDLGNSKLSSANYWTALYKTFGNDTNKRRAFNGFLGLQTKSSNQLDSGSGLQKAVFNDFARATKGSIKLDEATTETGQPTYAQHTGCWFKFGGTKDNKLKDLTWTDFTCKDSEGTEELAKVCKADTWFPLNTEYAPVRKIAKKIIECNTFDDLRNIAKTLGDAYDGYSYFSLIAEGTIPFTDIESMKTTMLKLLPSVPGTEYGKEGKQGFKNVHEKECFYRVKNAEAHTVEQNPRYVFNDTSAKTSFRLVLTQINKADVVEHNLHPTWNGSAWVMPTTSPLTLEEFWTIFFNVATESTVQQRVVTEIVKNAFGDEKLIVYDAQLYNQFDSVWIKDWSKKTIGA